GLDRLGDPAGLFEQAGGLGGGLRGVEEIRPGPLPAEPGEELGALEVDLLQALEVGRAAAPVLAEAVRLQLQDAQGVLQHPAPPIEEGGLRERLGALVEA